MTHWDLEIRPPGADSTYRGYEVTDHGVARYEINTGEVDGEVDLVDEIETGTDGN